MFTGTRTGNFRIASLNKRTRFLLETLVCQGLLLPMVGKLSESKNMLSGAGFISPTALNAFNKLVPFFGTTRCMLSAARVNVSTLPASNQTPFVFHNE